MNSSAGIQRMPIFTAVLVTIVVIPSLMDPINLPKLWILCLGAGFSLAIFSSQILALWQSPKRVLLFVSGTFALALLVDSIASPQGIFQTVIGVWGRNNGSLTYFALLIIFLNLASMNSIDPSKYLVTSLAFLGFLGALYGWMQNIGADVIKWENPGNKIILTLGNSNFASALLALTSIATLTLVFRTSIKLWIRFVLFVSFLVQMYLTMKSEALQGLLVLLIGSAILFGFVLTFSNRSIIRKLAPVWWTLILAISVLGIIGLSGKGPLSNILNPNLRSIQDRYYHWVAALNMMKDNLFFGVGIDSFGDYYRKYRTIEGVNFRTTPMSGTNNAHNTIMQMGSTGGLVLLLAYLGLIVFTGYRAIVALKKSNDKFLVSGLFSIWIAFQIQSLVSIDQIGLVVWGWATAGCLVALSYGVTEPTTLKRVSKTQRGVEAPRKRSYVFIPALTILGLVPQLFLIPTIHSELTVRNKIIELVSSTSEDSLRLNAKSLSIEAMKSQQPEIRLQALQYLVQTKSIDISLDLASSTTIQFPNSFESWDALARIYEGLGQKEKALVARKMTVKLDPFNYEVKKLLEADLAAN